MLSRKEMFPLEEGLNMDNNFIWNVKDPEAIDHAVNKKYVDDSLADEKILKRDSSGNLDMKSKSVKNLGAPVGNSDASSKYHVDNQ